MLRFIIFGKNYYQYNGFDINKYIYADAIGLENVVYIEPADSFRNRYLNYFYINDYGKAIRKRLCIPFRNSAYSSMLKSKCRISGKDQNVFVFFLAEPWFFGDKGFLAFLRKRYPGTKLVYYITNTVKNISHGPDYFKKYFDIVLACNRGDAEEYGIPFFPCSGSYIHFEDNTEPESDCLFVGQAKNRLDYLRIVYDTLRRKGVKCEFYISGVKEKDLREGDGIHYNQLLNYDIVLRKVEKTKVILELLQDGMDTHTMRYPEAVNYGKKLITNNKSIVCEKNYLSGNIRVINSASDAAEIEKEFFDSELNESYPDKDSVSARNLLKVIEDNLGFER